MELFENARKALLKRGNWPSPEQVAAANPGMMDHTSIFPTSDEIGTSKIPENPLAALQWAMRAEEDAVAFYSEQMERSDNPNGKATYVYLIEQEEHRAALPREYDYRVDVG